MDEDNCNLFIPHNDIASDTYFLIGCAAFYFKDYKKIPSEMEEAPPNKLLHFLILLNTAFTAHTA